MDATTMLTIREIARLHPIARDALLRAMQENCVTCDRALPATWSLGLDPSTSRLGWGVLRRDDGKIRRVNSGSFAPSKSKLAPDRYDQLAHFVWVLLHESFLKGQPIGRVAVEVPSGGQRQSAVALMAYARAVGACEAAAFLWRVYHQETYASSRVPHVEPAETFVRRVPVAVWKAGLGLTRRACEDKAATIVRMQMTFGHRCERDDEADGLAVALHDLVKNP